MAERVRNQPEIMKQRKKIVEHPCGTIKQALIHDYFLMRGLPEGRAEMSLTVFTYNLKWVLTILGVELLLEVLRGHHNNQFTSGGRHALLPPLLNRPRGGLFTHSDAVFGSDQDH